MACETREIYILSSILLDSVKTSLARLTFSRLRQLSIGVLSQGYPAPLVRNTKVVVGLLCSLPFVGRTTGYVSSISSLCCP